MNCAPQPLHITSGSHLLGRHGGPYSRCESFGGDNNPFFPPGFKLRIVQTVAESLRFLSCPTTDNPIINLKTIVPGLPNAGSGNSRNCNVRKIHNAVQLCDLWVTLNTRVQSKYVLLIITRTICVACTRGAQIPGAKSSLCQGFVGPHWDTCFMSIL